MPQSTLASVMAQAAHGTAEGVSRSCAPDRSKNNEGADAASSPKPSEKAGPHDTQKIVADAVAAERVRMAGLDKLALPGCESIISDAKASGASVEATAVQMVHHIQAAGLMDAAAALRASAETVPPIDSTPHDPVGNAAGAVAQTAEGWAREFRASSDLQKEFQDEASYVAFKENVNAGRVRVLTNKEEK